MQIVSSIPAFTGAYSVLPWSAGLEEAYNATDTFGEKYSMSRRMGNALWVPRNSCPVSPHDGRVRKPRTAIDCNFTPVNEEQGPLAERSINLLLQGVDHIFEAPTGWGKTVVGGLIACRVGQPTLIVVTKTDLVDAWKDALIQVLGVPPKMVGHIQQDVCDWHGKQFVIGMLHSLILPDRYPEEMYPSFGMLLLDEVHLMAADSFQEICWKFPAFHRLGFSATPDRKDGRTKLLNAHIGETLVKGRLIPMKSKVLLRKTGWKIPQYRDRETMDWVKIPHGPGRMMLVTKAQAQNQQRNLLIVEFVLAAFKAGRRTVVMSDLRDGHLDRLFQMFCSAGISGDNIGYYVGQMSKSDLDFAKKKPVVLATYKMCQYGTNVPIWDTLVMATPRADVKQIIGRVLRQLDGKKQPVILDLIDDDKLLHSFHLSRLKQYYAVGAEVIAV